LEISIHAVTELEIEEGLKNSDGVQSAYLYRREIKDVVQHLSEKSVGKYVDVTEFGNVDDDAQVN